MNLSDIVFIVFGFLTVVSAISLIFTKDVFRGAFLLLICLISLAGIYVLLSSNYLAVVQLLIYGGGIVVLLSFGIMLTSRLKGGGFKTRHHLIFPAIVVFFGLAWFFYNLFDGLAFTRQITQEERQIEFIGTVFITDYLLSFELIAFLLLVALIGAALYAKKSSES